METVGEGPHGTEQLSPSIAPLSPAAAVFFGGHGLRAGWRLAIYAGLYYALRVIVLTPASPLFGPHGLPQLWSFLVSEFLLALIAIAPAVVMCRLEQRPFSAYGLAQHGAFGKNFWVGAVWGFAAFTCLLLAMRVLGLVSFAGFAIHGLRLIKFAAFWALMFITVGFREEFLFRGYTLFTLTDGIGFWPAAVIMAVCFGGVHLSNPGEDWVGITGAAAIGLFFSFTLRRTGTLWFAIGMHMSWDWAETYFYSVPDSGLVLPGHLLNTSFHGRAWLTGGSVGPEASVLLFVLIAVMWVVFDRLYPRSKYPSRQLAQPAA
jgi:membrane protease YdiL (CAAX protease family)